MQVSISEGYTEAIWFAMGVLLVEMVYVRISLVAMDKIRKQERIMKILEWITLFVIVALAVSSFIAASKNNPHAKSILLSSGMPKFVLGAIMSALNPMQIPFWFGWSTVLFTKKVLLPLNSHYNLYIAGIGLGTFSGTCVFIFGGQLIVEKLNANQNMLNWVIGGIFSVTAIIQFWKMRKKPQTIPQTPEGA